MAWLPQLQKQNPQKSLEYNKTTFPSCPYLSRAVNTGRTTYRGLFLCLSPSGSSTDLVLHLFLVCIVFNPRSRRGLKNQPAPHPSLFPRSPTCGSPNSSLCREVTQCHGDAGKASGSPEIRSTRVRIWGAWRGHCLSYGARQLCA